MSSVTRISNNAAEADQLAAEERRLEIQRRIQLQTRGKSNLSLSSLNEIYESRLPTFSCGRNSIFNNFRSGSSSQIEELREGNTEEHGLEEGILAARALVEKLNSNRQSHSAFNAGDIKNRRLSQNGLPSNSTLEDGKDFEGKKICTTQESGNSKNSIENYDQIFGNSNTILKAGFLDNTHRSCENLLHQREVETLIYRAQMLATQLEPQDGPIIEMMNNLKLMSQLENTDFSLHKKIDRGLRFLGAFVDELPGFGAAEKNISASCDEENEGINVKSDDKTDLLGACPNKQKTAYIDARNNESAVRNDASNDAHALQAYLQAISAAATAANTRVLIGRLDKLSEFEPYLALQRIRSPELTNGRPPAAGLLNILLIQLGGPMRLCIRIKDLWDMSAFPLQTGKGIFASGLEPTFKVAEFPWKEQNFLWNLGASREWPMRSRQRTKTTFAHSRL